MGTTQGLLYVGAGWRERRALLPSLALPSPRPSLAQEVTRVTITNAWEFEGKGVPI